ncbi:conserved hypothetical protein [Pyrobaculum islandicum DSM 4184]|uniref:Phosphatidate cytidylyltransferase n=1 Tax=Pyrobaculum islandicum (strain DSM 4184 / JCM 9189 / GEO3) TaxID=384616 RepID=A1RSI0_PYRIL|nr:phosphatidate cytidylyltransferase [Pyrobaculum islandicum]ABL87912.1 conserved hypothetical protein [Pyrobaculum islandicum DSM 4184]
MSKFSELRALLARKIFHVIFVLLLAVPVFAQIPAEPYIAFLAFVSGIVYSIQVKKPYMWEEFRQNFFRTIEEIFDRLEILLPLDKPELKTQYQNAVRQLEQLIVTAERDYEKRHGYLGILMGAVGFLITLTIFGSSHITVSLVSMAVYDAISAIAGTVFGGKRALGKLTIWGTFSGAICNILALTAVGVPPLKATVITIFVVIADALSYEDNLTIPIAAAAGSYLCDLL